MKPIPTALGLMLVAVTLSGCVTPAEYAAREAPYWSHPQSSPDDFYAERKICVDDVEDGLLHEDFTDPLFPTGAAARRQAAMDWAKEEYLACMHQRGWVLAQGTTVGPPGEIYYP